MTARGYRSGLSRALLALLVGCACVAGQTSCTGTKTNAVRTSVVQRGDKIAFSGSVSGRLVRHQEPAFPTYDEAKQLMEHPEPKGTLGAKLKHLFRTPIINNEAWFAGQRPTGARSEWLGPFLRVASWNIEKSLEVDRVAAALQSEEGYRAMLAKGGAGSTGRIKELLRQRERLATSDVIFLQEMDIGVSRSGYIDAARVLAKALGMNYAFATQAVEVDPVILGLEPEETRKGEPPHFLPVDKARYKGGFGSAVLSKYPILRAQVVPLTKAYDWHEGESQEKDFVEHGRRLGSRVAFKNEIRRELKVGGRCYFRVDIAVPQAPGGVMTLVNNHLEIKTTPQGREEQMKEVLQLVKNIPHPVIMAGDHNTAPEDLSPTSLGRTVWRQVNTPSAMANTAANLSDLVTGTVVPFYRERGIVNVIKNFQNPLAPDVPIIFPNPVLGLFERVRDHRFADGSAFDFRGNRERSINRHGGVLANSNEHRLVGQRTTFSVRRPIGPIGRYRLDWFFVRSGLIRDPNDNDAPYRLAPHYGETLAEFNDSVRPKFSDHRPIIVDIPLEEPPGIPE